MDDSREFLIRIIVEALNRSRGVMREVAGDVDKLTDSQKKADESADRLDKRYETLGERVKKVNKDYSEFIKEVDKGNKNLDDTRVGLDKVAREMESISRAAPIGSKFSEDMSRLSRDIRRQLADIKDAETSHNKAIVEDRRRTQKELDKIASEQEKLEKAHHAAIVEDLKRMQREELSLERAHNAAIIEDRKRAARDELNFERAHHAAIVEDRKRSNSEIEAIDKAHYQALGEDLRRSRRAEIELDRAHNAAILEDRRRNARQLDQTINSYLGRVKEQQRSEDSARKTTERWVESIDKQAASISKLRNEVRDAVDDFKRFNSSIGDGVDDHQRAVAVAEQHVQVLSSLTRRATTQFGAGSDEAVSAARGSDDARHALRGIREEAEKAGREVEKTGGFLARLFRIGAGDVTDTENALKRLDRAASVSHGSIASLSGRLRGLVILGVVAFFTQLVSVVTALGSTLISVASAAIEAGGAIGGALVAGIAQAIPVIGLLISAFGRIGAVFRAVQQASKATQSAADDHTAALDRQRSAAEAVKSAQESLAEANRRVAQAHQDLDKAVAGSADEYEKLKLAVDSARDAQLSAQLELEDSTRSRDRAIAAGDIDAQARNEISVREAGRGVISAGIDRRTAGRALAQAGGPGGVDSVVNARQQLQGAESSARQAQRTLDNARESARKAADETQGAVKLLDQLKSQLDDTELKLFNALERLQKEYKKVFRPISDTIVGAFTYAVDRVTKILPKLGQFLKPLADEIATQMRRVTKALTDSKAIEFFKTMSDEARKNLGPLTTLALSILHIGENIAKAASPALRKFIEFLVTAATKADQSTSSSGGLKKLENFFLRGEEMAESILKLTWAIIQLFGAIVGSSADSGKKSIDDLTKKVKEATIWIENNQNKVKQFFEDARKATYEVLGAVNDLIVGLAGLYHSDQVKALTDAFRKTLLPALLIILGVTGEITYTLLKFIATPVGSELAKWGLAVFGLHKFIGLLGGGVAALLARLGALLGSKGLINASTAIVTKLGPWGLVIAGITTAIILLDQRFHFIKPTIEAIGNAFNKVWPSIQRNAMAFFNWIKNNWEGILIILTGPIGVAIVFWAKHFDLLKAIVVGAFNFIKNLFAGGGGELAKVLGTPFRIMFDYAKAVFAALLAVIKGVIETITHIARGEWGEAWDSFKSIFVGVFNAIFDLGKNIGRDIVRGMIEGWKLGFKFFENIAGWLYDHLLKPILKFFGIASPSTVFADIGKDLARGIVQGFKLLPSLLLKAVSAMAGDLFNIGKMIVKTLYSGLQSLNPFGETKLNKDLKNFADKNNGSFPRLSFPTFSNPTKKADGGPIPGSPSAGDVHPALLTGGEHVWTAGEVSNAGGHSVMFALRSFFGGGGQGGPVGYAAGGAVGRGGTTGGVDFQGMIAAIADGGGDLAKAWRRIWNKITDTVDSANDAIRRNIRSSLKRINSDWDDSSHDLIKSVGKSLDNLTGAVYDAMSYIGTTTNSALKAYDASPVKLSIDKPKSTADRRASGGVMGQWGEKGKDMIHTLVGRGEVVLNWAQQAAVNAKMRGQDTVQSVVENTRALHAGTWSDVQGFATGRAPADVFNGHPSNVHPAVKQLVILMKRHFPRLLVSSTTDHPYLTTSGNVSDHTRGDAVDMASNDYPYMNRAAAWVKSSGLFRFLKQGIHNPNLAVNAGQIEKGAGIFAGHTWREHLNHIHLAIIRSLTGDFGSGLGVGRINVGGNAGPLKDMVKKIVSSVRGAAKKSLDKASMAGLGDETGQGAEGGTYSGPLDRTFVNPSTAISRAQTVGLAIKAGFKQKIAQLMGFIAQAESGFRPGIVNSIGATGLWQIYNHPNLVKQFGDMRNPWHNAQAAFSLYNAAGLHPWDSSRGFWLSHQAGLAARGLVGKAMPIIGHAGEWVLNKGQQARAALMAGMSPSQLKGRLGFSGGPLSFAGGGEIGEAAGQQISGKSADFEVPVIISQSAASLASWARKAARYMANLGATTSQFEDAFQALAGDGGLIDQLATAVTNLTNSLALKLKQTTYKIDQFGRVVLRRDPTQQAAQAATNLVSVYNALVGERGAIQEGLDAVTKRLEELRKGGITDKEQDLYNKLIGYRRNLSGKLTEVDQAIADNVEARYQAVEAWVNSFVTGANDRAGRRTSRIDVTGRFAALIGPTAATAIGIGPQALAGQRQGVLNQQIKDLQGAQLAARAAGRGDIANQISDQIRDLQVQIAEAAQAGIQGAVDEVTARYARQTARNDIATRVATALGRVGEVRDLISNRITIVGNEIADLVKQRDAARAAGLGALADTIDGQIDDLQTSIVELTAQQLQDSIDIVNNAASRRSSQLDLRDRGSALREQAGDFAGAFSDRATTLGLRGDSLSQQRNALYGFLAQAQIQGNTGQVNALTDQIADLSVSIEENVAALKSNTIAARQAAIDRITGRGGFLGGTFGSLGGLLTSLASNTGTLDVDRQKGLIQQVITVLGQTGSGLRDKLFEGFGIDVRGLNGTSLVDALSSLDYDGIEANFSVDQRQQFESLIGAVIENASATEDNTNQLNQLNGNNVQSFSSTAWQLFRNAIFNGAGGLLTNYQRYATMAGGGTALTDGFLHVHAGERMIPAQVSRDGGDAGNFVSVVEVTEQVREYDPEVLANKQEFRYRNRSTSARRGR